MSRCVTLQVPRLDGSYKDPAPLLLIVGQIEAWIARVRRIMVAYDYRSGGIRPRRAAFGCSLIRSCLSRHNADLSQPDGVGSHIGQWSGPRPGTIGYKITGRETVGRNLPLIHHTVGGQRVGGRCITAVARIGELEVFHAVYNGNVVTDQTWGAVGAAGRDGILDSIFDTLQEVDRSPDRKLPVNRWIQGNRAGGS